jgi:hypothetical protein
MKNTLTLIFLFSAFCASAQLLIRIDKTDPFKVLTFQNTLSNKPNVKYIELSVGSQTIANDIEIYTAVLDIGELKNWLIADASGTKPMKFNSPMDVFNYLNAQGWTFVSGIEDTRSTALWAKLMFDVNTVRTKMTYIFKR